MNKILSFIALAIVVVGCSPTYYVPNTQNVPLISERGETNLTFTGNVNQVEFQGALGVGERTAIKLDAGIYFPSDLDNGDGGSGKFIEGGVGYFTPIGDHFVFETYGIFGMGSVENHFPSTTNGNPTTDGEISARIIRFGVQPNIGFKNKFFTAGISTRLVNVFYGNIQGNLIFDGENQQTYLADNSSNFMIEPALTLRGGFEKVKLQAQYGYSFNLSNSDFKQGNSNFSLGVNFNF